MRTTLTLDPDVAAMLKKAAAGRGESSFKSIVNEALRKGLASTDTANKPKKIYKVRPWPNGGSEMPPWHEMKEILYQEDLARYK
jgi:hypothetical protein